MTTLYLHPPPQLLHTPNRFLAPTSSNESRKTASGINAFVSGDGSNLSPIIHLFTPPQLTSFMPLTDDGWGGGADNWYWVWEWVGDSMHYLKRGKRNQISSLKKYYDAGKALYFCRQSGMSQLMFIALSCFGPAHLNLGLHKAKFREYLGKPYWILAQSLPSTITSPTLQPLPQYYYCGPLTSCDLFWVNFVAARPKRQVFGPDSNHLSFFFLSNFTPICMDIFSVGIV